MNKLTEIPCVCASVWLQPSWPPREGAGVLQRLLQTGWRATLHVSWILDQQISEFSQEGWHAEAVSQQSNRANLNKQGSRSTRPKLQPVGTVSVNRRAAVSRQILKWWFMKSDYIDSYCNLPRIIGRFASDFLWPSHCSYPLSCIRLQQVQRCPRRDQQGPLSSFLSDISTRLQNVCGFPTCLSRKHSYCTGPIYTTVQVHTNAGSASSRLFISQMCLCLCLPLTLFQAASV